MGGIDRGNGGVDAIIDEIIIIGATVDMAIDRHLGRGAPF